MEVSRETLRMLNGAALKVYIVVSNHPQGVNVREITDELGMLERTAYKGLRELSKRALIERKGSKYMPLRAEIAQKVKDKESNKEKEIINETINTSASTTKEAASVFSVDPFLWLTDDAEAMRALVANNKLPLNSDYLQTLTPYINAFIEHERAAGTDFKVKGRADTKRHFAAWLPKYLKLNNLNENNYGNERISIQHPGNGSEQSNGSANKPNQSRGGLFSTPHVSVSRPGSGDLARACAAGIAAARAGRGLL